LHNIAGKFYACNHRMRRGC